MINLPNHKYLWLTGAVTKAFWNPRSWFYVVTRAFINIPLTAVIFIASPVVIVLDILYPRRSVDRRVILGFLLLLFLAGFLYIQVQALIDEIRGSSFEIVTAYSRLRGDVKSLPFSEPIILYSLKYDLDPALIAAVIDRESRFDPNAVSPAGARGLMQLLPSTWRYLNPASSCDGQHAPPARGSDCIFAPEANIEAGTRYLRKLLDEFRGDTILAFSAYNAGPTNVRRYAVVTSEGIPPIAETQKYVRDVISNWVTYHVDPVIDDRVSSRLMYLSALQTQIAKTAGYLWLILAIWVLRRRVLG